ncbi:MAG: glutamine amidotransferase [Thermoleophilia bacterium]|nr:glutamine amidotransferase [Thermoleophilia bacterium]
MEIRIAHLYPALLNIYADRGNIICLAKNCQWRGIDVVVDEFDLGKKPDWEAYDFFYLGGGQDRDQLLVCRDLAAMGSGLMEAVEAGAVLLAVCGGYQLLGEFYRTAAGETMEGVGLFRAYTVAGQRRCIGNVALESDMEGRRLTLAGFENHSGKTYLRDGQQPLGRVVAGFGNNAEDGTEGIIHKNAIGTYLHGPLLPKNALLTHHLLEKSLKHRYGPDAVLTAVEHALEDEALDVAVRLARR